MPTPKAQQFILLPPRGLVAGDVGLTTPGAVNMLTALNRVSGQPSAAQRRMLSADKLPAGMRVLDSIREDGAKLVELSASDASDLRAQQPGLRLVPVVYFRPARARLHLARSAPKASAATVANTTIKLTVISRGDGKPIAGVTVVAFTDFVNRVGAQGVTGKSGVASLKLGAASKKVERLYLYCPGGFWNGLEQNVTLKNGMQFSLAPIDLGYKDGLRYFYGNASDDAGRGVKVGVIDTGIATHPDLVIEGGTNTVTGEDPNDFGDNGEGHGTHVAGIIAARGKPPQGIRGLAPGVTLRSYRVFPKKQGSAESSASNFSIAKAIDQAVSDGCDLINMSLGGGKPDEATHSAIAHARASGTLVFVAAGNDYRRPVAFPGSDAMSLAISALGRKGTFPDDSTEVGDVETPFGKDKANFIAAFSNVGHEIALTAPGDGIISTYPGPGYAVLDGTSMACPAATGAAARLLAAQPAILNMARDQARSDAMAKAVLGRARSLGFDATFEGQGML